MIYVCVECPKCGQENEVDETLKSFYCLKCGAKCDLEFESIYEPDDDVSKAPATNTDEEAEKRLKRAMLFIEDGDWARAWSYCESVLDYDPENAEAYLAELLVTFRLHSLEELKICDASFRNHPLLEKAARFADEDLRQQIDELSSNKERQARYERAKRYMKTVGTNGSLMTQQYLIRTAIEWFDSLGSFEDSEKLAEECRQIEASLR